MLSLTKSYCALPLSLLCYSMSSFSAEESELVKRPQTVNDVFVRSGVLTPEGQFAFDFSLSYTQNSSNRVSVVGYTILPTLLVGRIEVSDSDRTTITAGGTVRYGISDDTEIELRIPYVYRNDQVFTREIGEGDDSASRNSLDGGGLGDIELAVRHQFNFETTPYWIGGITVKSDTGKSPYDVDINSNGTFNEVPTGSGFWSVEPSLSMLYPTDPAVLYANISYIYNFKDDVTVDGNSVEVDLGDTIGLGAGMGFAINPDLSLSMGLSHQTILKSKVDGSTQENARMLQLDTFNFGVNYAFNRKTSLNIGVQAGLTEDAPDFQLTVRVPFSM